MKSLHIGLGTSLLALAAWLALTLGLATGQGSHAPQALWEPVAAGLGWPWLLAAAFGLVLVLLSDRRAQGLRMPRPISSVRLAWLPLLYALGALGAAMAGAPLPSALVWTVLSNTALVALSEELMFRGILLHGFMARFRLLPAVLLSSAIFGSVHALNGLSTGDAGAAWSQSVAAGLQGVGYAAVRLRTRSLWPIVVVHALYDGGLMLLAARAHPGPGAGGVAPWLGIVLVLPVFVYGLFLLRGDKVQAGPQAPAASNT